MRVIVRDEASHLYWSGSDHWVAEVAAAWEFQTLQEAAQRALKDRVRTTSVVLSYQDPVCELALNPDFCVERTIRRQDASA